MQDVIEAARKIVEDLENRIRELQKECEALDTAQSNLNCKNSLFAGSDEMSRCVEKACDRGSGLRVMDWVRESMTEAIKGPKLTDASQAFDELLSEISQERNSRLEKIGEFQRGVREALEKIALLAGGKIT